MSGVRRNLVDERIIRNPKICGGQPVFKGTRVTLRTVLASLAEGDSAEEIIADFPTLTAEDLRAAIAFAAASAEEDMPVPAIVPEPGTATYPSPGTDSERRRLVEEPRLNSGPGRPSDSQQSPPRRATASASTSSRFAGHPLPQGGEGCGPIVFMPRR